MKNARAFRQIRGPLPLEIRKKENSAGAGRNRLNLFFEGGNVPAKKFPDLRDRGRDIHGTDEWKPMIGRITKGRDFALWVNHRLLGKRADGSGSSKAHGGNS